ncbi:helix-turn-helix domain-containing protein [Phytobacter diazotrophicus]|uniref:helix-turn-helix domain-containing protein n=1 Tax=Phytobacter diazotrophicus TaxID=395631 RepID=UPI00232C6237|nr:helix-turn-helix domain-containing protein [Phytobacter diazotrophicus]MDC0725776.1 helix-turn-helix domain-containing protein [Phytobacter diazotrophicus]MDC0732079.1 helix-turn-helix domain-containing protein [Phytobacter diazotrophicus]
MPQLQATVIMEITMWIDANLDKNITIAIAAKRAGYSKRHLQRIFKHHTGLSLVRYIRQKKIMEATSDLQKTSMPIIEIASKYGFDDQQSFSKAFKKIHNAPPGQWRKKNGE